MPNLTAIALKPIIARVRNSASEFNGYCTWHFSQIKSPVAKVLAADKETSGGICEMLSAKWILCHANGGSLATWLSKDGQSVAKEDIDASKIRILMQLFLVGSEMNTDYILGESDRFGHVDQTGATNRWLAAKGVVQRKSIKPMTFLNAGSVNIPIKKKGSRSGGDRATYAGNIASEMAGHLKNSCGDYCTIGLWGPNDGHAMAAWVGSNDAVFFDPNFGEFWFQNKKDFISWFPTFFKTSLYSLPYLGLCEKYEIREFGAAMKHASRSCS